MNLTCPTCGLAAVSAEIRPKSDQADLRMPSVGSMIVCGGCGGVFEVTTAGVLAEWQHVIPPHIQEIRRLIRSSRILSLRRKAVLN